MPMTAVGRPDKPIRNVKMVMLKLSVRVTLAVWRGLAGMIWMIFVMVGNGWLWFVDVPRSLPMDVKKLLIDGPTVDRPRVNGHA